MALRERLAHVDGTCRAPSLRDEVRRIQERIAALPVLDTRSDDEILGYDAAGIPRVRGVVLGTSAVLALLQEEPEAGALLEALVDAGARSISAATLVEAGVVLHARYGDHASLARSAFRRFGTDVPHLA